MPNTACCIWVCLAVLASLTGHCRATLVSVHTSAALTDSRIHTCSAGRTSAAGATDLSDCVCDIGVGGASADCTTCESGNYKTVIGNTPCDTCPLNSMSLPGSTRTSECLCVPGFTGSTGPDGCVPCGAGSYKTFTGNSACVACPAHSSCPAQKVPSVPSVREQTAASLSTVSGWRLVRYLPIDSFYWFKYEDDLKGIITDGDDFDNTDEINALCEQDQNSADRRDGKCQWTIPFGDFDQFFFSDVLFSKWIHCTKDAAIGAFYGGLQREILRSSLDPSGEVHTAPWFNREGYPGDPMIGVPQYHDKALYQEGSSYPYSPAAPGSMVFVRDSMVSFLPEVLESCVCLATL